MAQMSVSIPTGWSVPFMYLTPLPMLTYTNTTTHCLLPIIVCAIHNLLMYPIVSRTVCSTVLPHALSGKMILPRIPYP